jgi:hypothetical protein
LFIDDNKLDLLPGIIMALDLSADKVVFANAGAKALIPYLNDTNVISELCKRHPELERVHQKVIDLKDSSPQICKLSDRYISYAVNKNGDITYVMGMDITNIISAGFVEPSKSKSTDLGVYTRESGVAFLDIFLRGVGDSKRPPFTISYIILDRTNVKDADREAYVKEFIDVIMNGIRGTDVFAQMEEDEFFILFPKCSFDVVNNIIMTIESKLDLISDLDTTPYEFVFNYAIAEINETNLDSVDTIIDRVRSMI